MKVKCLNPLHKDESPSMEIYPDGAYCFACGFSTNKISDPNAPVKPKEDISKTMEYIDGLPKRQIRGLLLPFDESGYYIVWGDRGYYKKRLFEGKSRYLGPSGHRPTLLQLGQPSDRVLVIEGEMNALSASLVYPGMILSPGASTNFMSYCSTYLLYTSIYAIVDKDIPGVVAGLKLKEFLLKNKKVVSLVAKEKDYNQILQDEGQEALKKTLFEDLGL